MLNLQELQTSGVCTDSPPQQFHNRKLELKTENADDGEVHAEHLNCWIFHLKLRKTCKNILKGCSEYDESESEITKTEAHSRVLK